MKKLIIVIGIVFLVLLVFDFILLAKINKISQIKLGGTTNFDSLELSETLSVTGASTLTGATTVTGELSANGGFIVSGRYDYGHEASGAFSAAAFCGYNLISIMPTNGSATSGDDGERGASMSFPDDETLTAVCLDAVGDTKVTYIDNTSSGSAYLDFDTTGIEMDLVSKSADFTGSDLIRVEMLNYDGTSISWRLESYTDQDGE